MLSDRIRRERQKKGISMRKAAQDMGFAYTTYVNYEKGFSEPNSDALVRIALYYKVSVDYLLGCREEEIDIIHKEINDSVMEDVEIGMGAGLRHPLTKMNVSIQVLIASHILPSGDLQHFYGDPVRTASPFAHIYIENMKQKEDFCFWEVPDDSMSPFLEPHDYVLVELNSQIESGDCAVIFLDEKPMIRKIEFDEDELDEYRIMSYNRYFPTITLRKHEFSRMQIAGRIDRVIRLL